MSHLPTPVAYIIEALLEAEPTGATGSDLAHARPTYMAKSTIPAALSELHTLGVVSRTAEKTRTRSHAGRGNGARNTFRYRVVDLDKLPPGRKLSQPSERALVKKERREHRAKLRVDARRVTETSERQEILHNTAAPISAAVAHGSPETALAEAYERALAQGPVVPSPVPAPAPPPVQTALPVGKTSPPGQAKLTVYIDDVPHRLSFRAARQLFEQLSELFSPI